MKKESGRKLRLEINGIDRELPEELIELIVQNKERISNVYDPQSSLNQTRVHVSPVIESLGALYGSMSDFNIKNDYAIVKSISDCPLADLSYKVIVPSLNKWSSLGIPYVAIKFAYITHIITMIALADGYRTKDVVVVTRNHTDALILAEALSELKIGIRVSTEKQGSVMNADLLPKNYNLVNSVDIYYQEQPNLAEINKSFSINQIFIDCRGAKEISIHTPGYWFYKEAKNVGYASMAINSYDVTGIGLHEVKDHPIVRVIDTLSNMEGMKGGKRNLCTHFINMTNAAYQEVKTTIEEMYNISFFSDHKYLFGANYGDLTQIDKYKQLTTETAYRLNYPILFIDGDGGLTYASPKAYADQYIYTEVKSVEESFKERLGKYYEDLKTQELNPETIDLLYKVNSLLKEV